MPDLSDPKVYFDSFVELWNSITSKTPAATLSGIGLLFIVLTFFAVYKVIKTDANNTTSRDIFLVYAFTLMAIAFSVAGPAYSLLEARYDLRHNVDTDKIESKSEALANLKVNKFAGWLVRLVPYDPAKEPSLSIAHLETLGRPGLKYVFVTDYNELRGYSVADAVRKVGGRFERPKHVSAIIFPKYGNALYPANALGVLQVIKNIQSDEALQSAHVFDLAKNLKDPLPGPNANGALPLSTWSFEQYKPYYHNYCMAVQNFRCGDFAEASLISLLDGDWHPLGFSKITNNGICNPDAFEECNISDWDKAAPKLLPTFGARAFLIKNLNISEIAGRYLVDFDDPENEKIPDLKLPPPSDSDSRPDSQVTDARN